MRRLIALAVLASVVACGGGTDETKAVEDTVRASMTAENAKDADAFLALWTDKGLESYDVGSREDVKSGKSENFGSDRIDILKISDTKVTGDTANTTVDGVRGENNIAKPLFQVKFELAKKSGKWLMDGFEFLGSPPPAADAKVVDVKAIEYAFSLDAGEAPAKLAFKFTNQGKEAHEITLFKAPDAIDVSAAQNALANVDGQKLDNAPAGYAVDHLTFAEPGQSIDVAFAEPLAAGTYVLACFIPQGGFNEQGPVDPNGKPHIQLGMINLLKVT